MKKMLLIMLVSLPGFGSALDRAATNQSIIDEHILLGFEVLVEKTGALSKVATIDCQSGSEQLRSAYNEAFDAWLAVSHLQFGPLETDNRTFDIAFWPDPRSFTPKALSNLLNNEDPIINNLTEFSSVSVAAKGFHGLEFLLYDETISKLGSDRYRCQLVRVVSEDLANTAAAVLVDWRDNYSKLMLTPAPDAIYRTEDEVLKTFFNALTTGLQFTSETRLGRPLGTFDKPRPRRAEARRSNRSMHNTKLSLAALKELGELLAHQDQNVAISLSDSFERALNIAIELDEPVFAGVTYPQSRLKIEILQQNIEQISTVVTTQLGPTLGVSAGFNSMDGD